MTRASPLPLRFLCFLPAIKALLDDEGGQRDELPVEQVALGYAAQHVGGVSRPLPIDRRPSSEPHHAVDWIHEPPVADEALRCRTMQAHAVEVVQFEAGRWLLAKATPEALRLLRVGLPGKAQISADREMIKREGKVQYTPTCAFDSKEVGDAFSAAVLAALDAREGRAGA